MPACARALREQRARERVGLDVHHHDVLAVRAARERVADAGRRVSGRVDDDLDLGGGDDARRVVGDEGRAVTSRVGERARSEALRVPADARERRAARDRDRGRRPRRRECPACAWPARDTSSRTCRRRSARRATAAAARRAPSASDEGSSSSSPSSTNACRAPSTPATRRVCMPSLAAASTLIALSSMNSTRPAGTSSASRTCSKYSASGFSLPTRYDGKLWWKAASSFQALLKRSQWISFVFDTLARRNCGRSEVQQLERTRIHAARPPRERGEELLDADGAAELVDDRGAKSSRPIAPVSKRRTALDPSQRRHSSSCVGDARRPRDHLVDTGELDEHAAQVEEDDVDRSSAHRSPAPARSARRSPTSRCRSARSTRPWRAPGASARPP